MTSPVTHPSDRDPSDPESSDLTPFAAALRAAVDGQRVSLSALARRLAAAGNPVSVSTLSYWRSGARHPEGAQSHVAISELERILDLEEGALLRLLRPSRRVGATQPPASPYADDADSSVLAETIAALDADPSTALRDVSSSTVIHVGRDGGVREYTTRTLVQATTGFVRSLPLMTIIDPAATAPPEFFAVAGGRITREYLHPSGKIIGSHFELDVPVRAPDTAMFEVGLRFPPGFPPVFDAGKGVQRRSRELVVWVHFDPDALPAAICEFEEDESGERTFPRTLSGTSIHAVRRGFGPGVFGLRWAMES